MATPAKPARAENYVNFFDDSMYVGGAFIPEGNYAVFFELLLHQSQDKEGNPSKDKQTGKEIPPRLGVMLTLHDLADPAHAGENARTQFLSMGTNADKSFGFDETGKRLVPLPGAAGLTLNDKTNWNLFRQSLVNCDPDIRSIMTDDFTVLDGIWLHIAQAPEPTDRKSFNSGKAATGEAAMEGQTGDRTARTTIVATEILPDGKPWESGGGIPEADEKPAKPPVKGKTTTKPPAKAKVAPEPSEDDVDLEDVTAVALSAVTKEMDGKAKLGRLILKTNVFTRVKKMTKSDDMASAVLDTFFVDDDSLNALLGEMNHKVEKGFVVPIS